MLRPGRFERTFSYDVARDTMTYTSLGTRACSGSMRSAWSWRRSRARSTGSGATIPSPPTISSTDDGAARGDWQVRTETARMRATREHFLIDAELDAYEGERRVFSRNWHAKIRAIWCDPPAPC